MHQFFADYFERFQWLYGEYAKAISGLEADALDWVPGAEMNSLCVLVIHITGSTRFWVGDVCMAEHSNRDRAAEFVAKGHSEAQLKAKLDENLAYIQSAMAKLTLDDLTAVRQAPGRNETFTVSWALQHALEHAGIHAGHAQLMRQLWDQR